MSGRCTLRFCKARPPHTHATGALRHASITAPREPPLPQHRHAAAPAHHVPCVLWRQGCSHASAAAPALTGRSPPRVQLAVVTRVVDSMVHAPRPTRAEATDVANLVLDGADGIILGAETFRGQNPVQAARTVLAICRQAELVYDASAFYNRLMDEHGGFREANLSKARPRSIPPWPCLPLTHGMCESTSTYATRRPSSHTPSALCADNLYGSRHLCQHSAVPRPQRMVPRL